MRAVTNSAVNSMSNVDLPAPTSELAREFTKHTGVAVRTLLASEVTTYLIGGPLEHFVVANTEEEVSKIVGFLSSCGERYRFIGAGSNLLVADDGLPGWTIKMAGDLRRFEKVGDSSFIAGAALGLPKLAKSVSQEGFSGLEFAGGIPGTVGGAVFMNAGAHGGETKDVLTAVHVILPSGEKNILAAADLNFSYRHSEIPAGSAVVAAEFSLVVSDKDTTAAVLAHNLEERRKRQPLRYPSAGSVFKNPTGDLSAGALIERCGLRGTVHGGAMISELHGNWIINHTKQATAKDVEVLIELCQERVNKEFNVRLEREVRLLKE